MSGSGPWLNLSYAPRALFKFPPDAAPPAVPPPFEEHSFKTPFAIPADVYNMVLGPEWPLTIALLYAMTVLFINAYNRRNNNQPWSISKIRVFRPFVILHNVFLAVYSAVTCVAMVRALKHALPHYTEHNALIRTVDALCKMHGPRGLGDAVTFNPISNLWQTTNKQILLGGNGLPDSTDVGRIWNEGLAFWGWIFYLSKFYEVFDTFIILAKGKRSSTLQTYHHAGAMLCMWAGIRYMSPPIWMFVLVNSGIHTMMYTYYTISALGFRVPQAIKRTLTSLQILQFVVGASFAAVHLFVSYSIPIDVPYHLSESPQPQEPMFSSMIATITQPSLISTASGGAMALLKKLVYRAAGEEGLAENVPRPAITSQSIPFDQNPPSQQVLNAVKRVVYRTEYHPIHCIDTTGQSFAIWLNLIYLFPLTGLFVRFFVKSYLRRTSGSAKHPTKQRAFSKSGHDALHGVARELESLGEAPVEDGINGTLENLRNRARRERTTKSASIGSASVYSDEGVLSDDEQRYLAHFKSRVSDALETQGLTPKSNKAMSPERAKTPEEALKEEKDMEEIRKSVYAKLQDVSKRQEDSNGTAK
ncbi:hypothetical protein K469DRAFT_686800 [Zopfia rhizophila CBS 207.26]|uniref:Elongation of fatty acids protein n=1 Tax=Zopfia rhizophila CBS 207.26 TaxID=1314779 RepID=A0A6A6EV35_9PEZI|nr:hypothetical protein K469DRAFT_686800 [Zopfia rhizophila CBS 207.26]